MRQITYEPETLVQMNFSSKNNGPPERSEFFGPFETREAAGAWAEDFIQHEKEARGFWTHPMWILVERNV